MAVAVISATERPHVGDVRFERYTLGSVGNADTFVLPGFASKRVLGIVTTNAVTNAVSWGYTASTGTFTAIAAGAATAVQVIVFIA